MRKGVISFLHDMGGIQVTIDVSSGEELIAQLQITKELPDVCLLDINLPGMSGFDTIIELKKKWPSLKILMLTMYNVDLYIIRAITYGARGYLLKNCHPDELKSAIQSVYDHGFYYSEVASRNFINNIKNGVITLPEITGKEMQVLQYIATDLTYEEIGKKIGTTKRSVEGFRDSLFNKLDIHSRPGLTMFAIQFGMISIERNN